MGVFSRVPAAVAAVVLASGFAYPAAAAPQHSSVLATRTLQNLGTQGCLTDDGEELARVRACVAGSANQQWEVSGPAVAQQLRNAATGQCLRDGGAGVAVMGPCGEQPFAEWASLWIATGPEDARQFRNLSTLQCVAALPGITAAPIGQCDDVPAQQWGTAD
ncbi:hypothetical protein [Streptomyces carpaticus]|uniref:RICIN domain-containing protein n=1 Tax=Streptomyces carpaticus TaxID=285558 RepID=UPI0031F82250